MRFIFFFFLVQLIISCGDESNPATVDPTKGTDTVFSVSDPYANNKRGIDSADMKKLYGPLVSGMNQKQVDKSKGFQRYDSIGNSKYILDPLFFGDSLYMVTIESWDKTANYYDTEVRADYANLVSVISQKYGGPDKPGLYPSFLDMQSGMIQFSNDWYLGDKRIRIGVGENESTYYACCWIYSESIYQRKSNSDKTSKEVRVKDDKEKF